MYSSKQHKRMKSRHLPCTFLPPSNHHGRARLQVSSRYIQRNADLAWAAVKHHCQPFTIISAPQCRETTGCRNEPARDQPHLTWPITTTRYIHAYTARWAEKRSAFSSSLRIGSPLGDAQPFTPAKSNSFFPLYGYGTDVYRSKLRTMPRLKQLLEPIRPRYDALLQMPGGESPRPCTARTAKHLTPH